MTSGNPPTSSQIKAGDKVRLKTGGPEMTVEHVGKAAFKPGGPHAWCQWFDDSGALTKGCFTVEMLEPSRESDIPALLGLERLLRRFHLVAQQLARRHAHRETLRINDEYDVQDLLHALLRIEFDDIRPEEWTPSYAGGSARTDFLLKKEQVVLELKKTRNGLGDKEVGEELIIDIARYKNHPDCRTLVCFVYDPDQRITNPAGLKHDLEGLSTDRLAVAVYICQH
jgi:uncharacterized protein YodC (DUF2158 family)